MSSAMIYNDQNSYLTKNSSSNSKDLDRYKNHVSDVIFCDNASDVQCESGYVTFVSYRVRVSSHMDDCPISYDEAFYEFVSK